MRVGRQNHRGVPEFPGLLAAWDPRQHRAEEGDTVDVDGRSADVGADRVHAGVVARAQRVVMGAVGSGRRQRRRQPGLSQGLRDDLLKVLVVPVVNPGAHGGIQRSQYVGPAGLFGGDGDPDRTPGLLHQFLVLLGQIAPLVEHREAHDMEVHVDIAHLLHLEDPPRGDPGPGAQRVEPEVSARRTHGSRIGCQSCYRI